MTTATDPKDKLNPEDFEHGEAPDETPFNPVDDEFSKIIDANYNKDDQDNLSAVAKEGGSQPSSLQPKQIDSRENAGGTSTPGSVGRDESKLAEKAKGNTDKLGAGYTPTDKFAPAPVKVGKMLARGLNKKNGAVAGGVGGVATLLIAMFLFLIPLKIESMIQSIQNKYFSSAEDAVEKGSERLFTNYVVTRVLPGYKPCGTTVTKGCRAKKATNGNPISNLYNSWSDARLENKLAEKHGIEFKFESASNSWYLKTRGTAEVRIGSNGEDLAKQTERSAFRPEYKAALKAETKWYQVMYRYKVGRLVESKYGVKRCLIFCGTKDKIANFGDDNKAVFKYYLAERVVLPRNEALGIVMSCLFDPSCQPDEVQAGDPDNPDHGNPESEVERDIRTTLNARAAKYGRTSDEDTHRMKEDYKKISEKGYFRFIVAKVFEKVGLSAVSERAINAIPVIGWLNFGAQVLTALDKVGPAAKKLNYVVNSGAAVSLFSMYRTYADEVHTGNINPTQLGSMTDSLSGGNRGDPNDPILGGTASAEETPLYGDVILNGSSPKTVSLTNFFSPSAYAAENKPKYICEDNNPVPAGKKVCEEEVLGQSNKTADKLTAAVNLPGVGLLTSAAKKYTSFVCRLICPVTEVLFSIFGSIPGVKELTDVVAKIISPLVEKLTTAVIRTPIGSNMSGGRTLDMVMAGADVAGNDFAHFGIGGRVASAAEITELNNKRLAEEKDDYQSMSFLDRTFSKDNKYSLVNRMALSMPGNFQNSLQSTASSFVSNPIMSIFGSIPNIFGGGNVFAADTPSKDPFNVPQYIYPDEDIPDNMEKAWDDNNCSTPDNIKAWNEEAVKSQRDDGTGMPVNKNVSVCVYLNAVRGSAGGAFDTDNLTDEDKKVFSGGDSSSDESADSGDTASVNGDTKELAQQILDNSKISFPLDASSPNGSTKKVLEEVAKGNKAPVTCPTGPGGNVDIKPGVLKFIVDLGKQKTIGVNAITDKCHSNGSNHYKGIAVDFECNHIPFDTSIADNIAKKYGGARNGETCGGNSHWHYDFK